MAASSIKDDPLRSQYQSEPDLSYESGSLEFMAQDDREVRIVPCDDLGKLRAIASSPQASILVLISMLHLESFIKMAPRLAELYEHHPELVRLGFMLVDANHEDPTFDAMRLFIESLLACEPIGALSESTSQKTLQTACVEVYQRWQGLCSFQETQASKYGVPVVPPPSLTVSPPIPVVPQPVHRPSMKGLRVDVQWETATREQMRVNHVISDSPVSPQSLTVEATEVPIEPRRNRHAVVLGLASAALAIAGILFAFGV
ncbi:MAG: hypothetical protein AAF851_13345 [Myxococcota bacterium]